MNHVKSILIVGGGSSGWMTAAYLSRCLSDIQITLVESATTPIIGVGEATIPIISNYLRRIGLANDYLWMPKCDATFKTGILYKNWFEQGDQYWHPLFENLDYFDSDTHVGHAWLKRRSQGDAAFTNRHSFYDAFFCTTTLNAQNNRIPASAEYAYHIDVHRFLDLLRHTASNVKHIVDNVTEVSLGEDGGIVSISTEQHGDLEADLYIDCTGFKRYLITQVDPRNVFIPYTDSLFCDSGVVLHFPYLSDAMKVQEMQPFVTAAAASAGWIWTIPLFSQISTGYVYSSSFISDDDAERELRRSWGESRTEQLNSFKVHFKTGKLDRLWVKNCIAIGLSGGFIEPLESTGLAITQLGVEMLVSMLDARFYDEKMIERYNGHLEKFYTDIMQFIIIHYCLTNREDTAFWRAVKHDTLIPQSLQARLDVFRKYLPTYNTKGTSEVWMFRDLSWFSVLLGMNFRFDPPEVETSVLYSVEAILKSKRKTTADMMNKLPNHYQYLKENVYRLS